ncbi:MAG: PspC domain-containing protein [Urechidicola sp.]|nr:PspC domain-containing protein [Urechidicola sp.]
MNKTININLGGLFFHIDETAYQKLNRYLNSIRKSLSDDPQGKDEIIKDIEMRISELLSERIVDERQVVSENDIDEIVSVMGQPEDYNVDEELFNETTSRTSSRKSTKKLYRDGDDKFLGGVAAGTGHYIGIEPIWSRIIWLILAFGTGLGFFAYILLWILLPKAESTAEKLEMEGETVNINSIEKRIREEFNSVADHVKKSANDVEEKISSADYKKYKNKAKSGLQEFLDTVGNIIMVLLKVFAKFIGALIIFIAAVTLISLIIGFFSWGSVEALGIQEEWMQLPPHFINTTLPYWLIILFGFIAIAIPFVVLFMLGIRILSNNAKSFGKITGLTLLALWIVAILGLVFSGIDFSSRYKHAGTDTTKHELNITPLDTLKISMISNDDFDDYNYGRNNNIKIIDNDGNKQLFSNDVELDIRNSDTDNAYIKIRKYAHGKTRSLAKENARKIEYQFNLTDKNLQLNSFFLNDFPNGFFDQDIDVIVYIPEGYTVYLDKSTKYYLDDVANVQNIYDPRMVKHHYIMTDSELDCLDCDESDHNTDEENVHLKIDDDGMHLKINSEDGEAEVKIDENGVTIK